MVLGIISRAYRIWERLYTRFSLEPGLPHANPPELLSFILPVTSADELLREYRGRNPTGAVSGNDIIDVVTVPQGERWTLFAVVAARSTGTFDLDEFRILDASRNENVIIESWTPATVHQVNPALWPLTIDEGDILRVEVANFVGAGNAILRMWHSTESAF